MTSARQPHIGRLRRPTDDGFTLMEALLALVLTALLSAGLATAIGTARRIMAATERNATANDVLAAQNFLRASLAAAWRAPVSGTQDDLGFLGSSERISLATGYAPKGLHQGLYRLDIALVPSSQGAGLVDLVAAERPSRPQGTGLEETPPPHVFSSAIIRGVSHVRFTYFGKPSADATAEAWVDTWTWKEGSPRLVRLELAFPPDDPRRWPTLVMPLEVGSQ